MTANTTFYMAGTEGSGEYTSVLATDSGTVGYRRLVESPFYRLRIEPASMGAADALRPFFPGYKEGMGGDTYRFSTMIDGIVENSLVHAVQNAVNALIRPGSQVEINFGAPVWAKDVVRDVLVTRLREAKVPGSSFASRWTLNTLVAKVAVLPAGQASLAPPAVPILRANLTRRRHTLVMHDGARLRRRTGQYDSHSGFQRTNRPDAHCHRWR